jgi:competence protein ComEA
MAIVEYRDSNGPFFAAEELINVKGIGPKTLEKNLENIKVRD